MWPGGFSHSRDVEEKHAELYKGALEAMLADMEPEYFVCQVCGYVFEKGLPEECPICRANNKNFRKIV